MYCPIKIGKSSVEILLSNEDVASVVEELWDFGIQLNSLIEIAERAFCVIHVVTQTTAVVVGLSHVVLQ